MSLNHTILYDIASATPVANTIIGRWLSDGFRNQIVTLFPAGTVNFTIKFAVSDQIAEPDFAAASSATNLWNYCEIIDLADGTAIDGATGVALSTSASRRFEFNSNESRWIGVVCTAWTSGTVSGTVYLSMNQ